MDVDVDKVIDLIKNYLKKGLRCARTEERSSDRVTYLARPLVSHLTEKTAIRRDLVVS